MENAPEEARPFLSVTAMAVAAGVHRNTVIRDIERALLPAAMLEGEWRIDPDDAQDYTDARGLYKKADAALAGIRARAQERIANRAR